MGNVDTNVKRERWIKYGKWLFYMREKEREREFKEVISKFKFQFFSFFVFFFKGIHVCVYKL